MFEKEADNPAVWRATLDALPETGITHDLIRIEEQRWSARPHYGIVLKRSDGSTITGTVGGPVNKPFSHVQLDIEEKDRPVTGK
ncbi:MAG: hypothetical protein HQ559_02355 [Lentisphaerae bacterium]|nr:hypothetical protein [Lentisphaerota bacterium]